MAAGLGFKTFNTGDVLSAADVNGYLMQGVLVFADAAARNAAITSPQEGQFAFTKDTNGLWYYDGAAWVASGATGDIEGVTAGTGISGGGTSGTITITNSMATAIDAKGDLIGGTGADTFARLPVGANGTILTADSAEATGLKWAAAAGGGGKILQVIQDTVTGSVSTTSASFVDTGLDVTITPATTGSRFLVMATIGQIAKFPNNVNNSVALEIVRGGTQIYYGADGSLFENESDYLYVGPISFSKVDSPATTSAITYKVRFANYVSGQTSTINHSTGGSATLESTLIVMEIGA